MIAGGLIIGEEVVEGQHDVGPLHDVLRRAEGFTRGATEVESHAQGMVKAPRCRIGS